MNGKIKNGNGKGNGNGGTKPKPKARKIKPNPPVRPSVSVTEAKIKSIVESAIAEEHKRLDFGRAGMEWMECVLNPLGNEGQGYKYVGAKLPDGTPNTLAVSFGSESTVDGGVVSEGMIVLEAIAQDAFTGPDFEPAHIFYGGVPSNPASSPTNHINLVSPDEWELIQAFINVDGARMRVISACIKVTPVSSPVTNSGVVRPFWHRSLGGLSGIGPPTYRTYNELFDSWAGPNYEVVGPNPGIQFRTFVDPEKMHFETPRVAVIADNGDRFGKMPGVYFSIGVATKLRIQYVCHIELEVPPNKVPVPISVPEGEEEIFQMIRFVNTNPCHIEGNSFPSFIKKVAATVKKGFKFYDSTIKPIYNAAKPLIAALTV